MTISQAIPSRMILYCLPDCSANAMSLEPKSSVAQRGFSGNSFEPKRVSAVDIENGAFVYPRILNGYPMVAVSFWTRIRLCRGTKKRSAERKEVLLGFLCTDAQTSRRHVHK